MTTSTPTEYGHIRIPNRSEFIPPLLSFIHSIAQLCELSPKKSRELELATEEACMDVIKNAFAPDEDAFIDITIHREANAMRICIHDMGLPYDPNMAPTYDPQQDLTQQSGDGLGVYLINRLVDTYQFHNRGNQGKEVCLVKYLDSHCVAEEAPPPDQPEVVEPPKAPAKPCQFEIRLMKPEEALEVCRCIYDSYGYTYANENIYYPDRVAAMNASGQLRSAVAVTEDGEMGGHFALIYYDHLPAELGIAVTKKKFRGQGFARQIGEFLEQEAIKQGLNGLQIKEVTVHPYTQKFCRKLGYQDCGILLAHSPKSLSFKGIADKLRQRNSDVLGFKFLKPPKPISIYPPAAHADMIVKLFKHIDVTATCQEGSDVLPGDPSLLEVTVHSIRSLAEIHIMRIGTDIQHAVRQELRKLFADEIQVIELYLSLDHPCAPLVGSQLSDMGFRFSGVLPETKHGNAMIMQYFNGVHINYDEIVIVSDTAKELLDYMRGQDPHAE